MTNPGAVLEKQQFSKQLAFSREEDVLRVAIIFRTVQRMKVIIYIDIDIYIDRYRYRYR